MLKKKLNFFTNEASGKTIFEAASQNDIETVKKLLPTVQINQYSQTLNYETLLHITCENGYLEMVELLLDNGADIEAPSLQAAFGWLSGKKIISTKEELADTEKLKCYNPPLYSPLMHAISKNHLEVVKLLVARGANINKEVRERSPLSVATGESDIEMMDFLISKGASVNASADCRYTPLFVATLDKNFEKAKFLMQKGAVATPNKEYHIEKNSDIERLFSIGPEYTPASEHMSDVGCMII